MLTRHYENNRARIFSAKSQNEHDEHRYSYAEQPHRRTAYGCLVFHLFGFCSNSEFFQWDVPDEFLITVSRVMRAWDYGQITADQARAALDGEIARRESAAPPPRIGSPARVPVEPQEHTLVG